MFGRIKTSQAVNKRRRWFFEVKNISDSEDAIRNCYQIFYFLAAFQAVMLSVTYVFHTASISNFIDPIFILVLAWFIDHKKSRTAAVMLGIYALLTAIITLENRMGLGLSGGFGGKNILLAAIALYGIYMGLIGTFKYHNLVQDKVIKENVLKMTGIGLIYNILFLGLFMLITVLFPSLEQRFWGYGPGAFSDDVVGGAMILCVVLASAGTAFRILPWTKNKPLIAIKDAEAH